MLAQFCVALQCLFERDSYKANCEFTAKGKQQCGNYLGWYGFLIAVKGDWKFEKEFFGQYRAYNSNRICCCCAASKDAQNPFVDRLLIVLFYLYRADTI
jgi:hypothetical protein